MVTRIKDASAIEGRLLELAHTTDAKITVAALAYFAPCSLEDASRVLDDLTVRDRLIMEVEDDGTVVYQLPGRQKLTRSAYQAPPTALVPVAHAPRDASPFLAAMLSVLVPGAGHLYTGRIAAALLWFIVVSVGYALIFPGLLLHVFNIVSAAATARRLNGPGPQRLLGPAGTP